MDNNLTPTDVPTNTMAEPADIAAVDPGIAAVTTTEDDVLIISNDSVADEDTIVITGDTTTPKLTAVPHGPVVDKTRTFKPVTDKPNSDLASILPSEHITGEELDKLYVAWQRKIKTLPNIKDRKAAEATLENLYRLAVNVHDEKFTEFFNDDLSTYTPVVEPVEGSVPIRIGHPAIRIPDDLESLSGESAALVVSKQMKSGLVTKTPCWHSGLVLTTSPYGDKELIDYGINMSRHQMNIGIDSLGATFTGDDIYMVGPALDMAIAHITNCQLKTFTPVTLRKTLLATDIPAILAGMLESIYPEGYPVHHICTNPECSYVLVAERDDKGNFKPDSLIDFSLVLKPHRPSLTPSQIRHMSIVPKSLTMEQVKTYQETLHDRLWGGNNNFVIWKDASASETESVSVVFKVPNLEEYMNASYEWVSNVTAMADEMTKSEPRWKTPADIETARFDYVNTYSKVTDIVKNLCWVEKIISTSNGISRSISGTDDIRKQLETYIQVEGVKEEFDKAMTKFKEMSIVAWTGIPNFACPQCGQSQTRSDSKTPSLIPLNMVGYFFSTMVLRRQKRQ